MKKFIALIFLSASFLLNAGSLDDFFIMTEQYPPYNFEENSKLKGFVLDLVTEILKRDKSSLKVEDIKLLPWARSYKEILEKPKTILFSMTRSSEREKLFKWVGPVSPTKIVLFALKNKKISIKNEADIKKLRTGAIQKDIGHQLLEKIGCPDISLSADIISNLKKLEGDRMDVWAYEENVAKWEIKNTGRNISDFEVVYTLLSADLYIAFNKSTSDEVINAVQKISDEIKRDGTYQKIVDKYLK